MNDKIRYFFPKVKNQLERRKNMLYRKLPIDGISLTGIGKIPTEKRIVSILSELLSEDCEKLVSSITDSEKDSILSYANHSLNYQFRYLGVDIKFKDSVSWNVDFNNGYKWPENLFYLGQRSIAPEGTDIKFPWELSRGHHLVWLGEAYLITHDEKYAQEVADELIDWIEKNPLMYSVNWTCAMEVAIRAVNWMYALFFIKDSVCFTDELAAKVYKSLYQHGFFIYNNLERTIPCSNNHYYSDIVGLLYLGQLFYKSRQGKKWFKFALKQYYSETLVQILPSGVDYEKSVSYHRLMTELALYPYYMLVRVGVEVPEIVRQRLIHMVQYVKLNAMPNGKAPMIADNDDGRFLPFVPRDFREHQYLVDANSLDSKIVSSGTTLLPFEHVSLESRLIQDSKIAILRRGESFLFVNNADRWRYDKVKPGYIGTHIHNDLLSFVYAVGNSEIMVDPGGYVYTADMERHREFRTTAKHNTIMVDGEEQHLREHPMAFMMKYNSTSRFLELSEERDCDICTGEYSTKQGQLTHNRSFRLANKTLTIEDRLMKSGKSHKASLFFHFAPGIEPTQNGDIVSFCIDGKQFELQFKSLFLLDISIKDDTISPSYGILQDSKTLVVEFEFDESAHLCTTINHG